MGIRYKHTFLSLIVSLTFSSVVFAAGALDNSLRFSSNDSRSLNNHEYAAQLSGSKSYPYGHTIRKHVNARDSDLRITCSYDGQRKTTYSYDSEARDIVRLLLRRNANKIETAVEYNNLAELQDTTWFYGLQQLNTYRKTDGSQFGRGIRCQGRNLGWPFSGMKKAAGYVEYLNVPGEKLMLVNGKTYSWYLISSFPII